MTKTIGITEPHGYLLDSDGKVVDRFGDLETGKIEVQEAVDSVEYIDTPAGHTKSVHSDYIEQ